MDLKIRTGTDAKIEYFTSSKTLNLEENSALIKDLREEFRNKNTHIPRADGKFFLSAYMDDFNKKPSMTKPPNAKDDFNRSAQPFLLAYFFAYSLWYLNQGTLQIEEKRRLRTIKKSFAQEAKRPLNKNLFPQKPDIDTIISDLENSVTKNLSDFINNNDDHDGNDPVTPLPEQDAA